jgi:hypothetical protein
MDTTVQIDRLDRATSDKVAFLSFIIPRFASAYKMSIKDSYTYLKQYGGLDYMNDCWWALHTDNEVWAVHDVYEVCRNNGGLR